MAILDNQLVSFQDLQDLIDGGGFQENNPFSPSDLLADKLECLDALVLDPAPLVPLSDYQLVQYDLLVSGDSGDVTKPAQMLITNIEGDSGDVTKPAQMTITDVDGGIILTQFNYNSTLGLISEVCGLTASTIAYHNGLNTLPDVGDNCYVDTEGNTSLGSTGSLYNKSGANEYIKIGSNGLITEQGTCGTGLRDFQLVITGYSLHTESCAGTNTTETKWHNGDLTYPEGQDVIFNTNNLGDIFNGADLWYKEPAISVTIKIGTDGVMDNIIGNC